MKYLKLHSEFLNENMSIKDKFSPNIKAVLLELEKLGYVYDKHANLDADEKTYNITLDAFTNSNGILLFINTHFGQIEFNFSTSVLVCINVDEVSHYECPFDVFIVYMKKLESLEKIFKLLFEFVNLCGKEIKDVYHLGVNAISKFPIVVVGKHFGLLSYGLNGNSWSNTFSIDDKIQDCRRLFIALGIYLNLSSKITDQLGLISNVAVDDFDLETIATMLEKQMVTIRKELPDLIVKYRGSTKMKKFGF